MKHSAMFLALVGLFFCTIDAHAWTINSSVQITRDNGEPFFPFGFYHVSWVNNRTGADRIADLNQIADAGFDLIKSTLNPFDHVDDPGFHAVAAQRDVAVIGEFYWPASSQIIAATRDYPAVVGYLAADDFNYPPDAPKYTVQQVADRAALVRSNALPSQLVYGSGTGYPCCELAAYAAHLDVVGPQVYPVGSDPNNTDLLWSLRAWAHVDASLPNTPYLAVLQTFAWKGKRYPTRAELRNMFYAALIHGADGVLAYAYWDQSGLLPQRSPATWDEIQILLGEVRSLEAVLLTGTRRVVTFPSQYLRAGVWESSGEGVVVALNTHATQTLQVQIPVAGWTRATPAFPNRPATLNLSDVALSGSIAKEQVQVFRLQR